jgi:AhpD family alkylhydroperoxidase
MARTDKSKQVLDSMLAVRTSYPPDVQRSRQVLAREAPEYLELFHKTYMYILHERKALTPKMKELIIIGVDAAQFYERGLRSHMRSALKAGATRGEIVEALLAASLAAGIHALSVAMPVFDDVMQEWEAARKSTVKRKPGSKPASRPARRPRG